ncbi:MAG: ABC transporter permease [Actinomycetota bacterium]|nr:ABC transporter permease [Actinomycetota bacterium]
MTVGQGERLLVTFVIPVLGLVLFSAVPIVATDTASRVDFFAPGVLGLAVVSTSMVNLGIATGFERGWGVLKRLGTTPLRSSTLLLAKMLAVLAVEVVQVVLLGAIAAGLGWRPHGSVGLAVAAELLGTAAFAGIGFLLAGTLRAEVTLAVANGLYVVMLGISGIMFPLRRLGGFAAVARLLPAAALTDVLHPALTGGVGVPVEGWIVLALWAVATPVVAAATFRFE